MANPPDLQNIDHEPERHAGSDREGEMDPACDTCISTRGYVTADVLRAAILLLVLAGVPKEAEALPPVDTQEDSLSLIDLNFLKQSNDLEPPMPNVDEWSKMPWDEVVKKLDKMGADRIKDIMLTMVPVVDEIKKISHEDINKKLQNLESLDASEKEFFLALAAKYCPESLKIIQYTFQKKILSKRDFHFLFIQFRQMLAGEHSHLSLYIHMREYLMKNRGWKNLTEAELARLKLMQRLLEGFERSCIFE